VSVSFKINFEEELNIFAQHKEPIYFSPNYGVKNLMDNDKFDQWFNTSPFCFYEIYNAHKSPLYCISQKFKVKCFSLKEQFLTIDINFRDIAH